MRGFPADSIVSGRAAGSVGIFPTSRNALLMQISFCDEHEPATKNDEVAWLLHRDITHALILPILHIFHKASRLGKSLLCAENIFDLELAFRGEARGAFSWLQCFFIEEEAWCSSGGCPGTVPPNQLRTLLSEHHRSMRCQLRLRRRTHNPPHPRRFPPLLLPPSRFLPSNLRLLALLATHRPRRRRLLGPVLLDRHLNPRLQTRKRNLATHQTMPCSRRSSHWRRWRKHAPIDTPFDKT